MARTYSRDKRGRFASKGSGATARGARIGGKRQAANMGAGMKSSAPRGTIAKGGNGIRGSVARSMAATRGQMGGTTVTRSKGGNSTSFGKKSAKNAKLRAEYKRRSGEARSATKSVDKMKARGKYGAREKAHFGKAAAAAKASLTRLTNSRGKSKSKRKR